MKRTKIRFGPGYVIMITIYCLMFSTGLVGDGTRDLNNLLHIVVTLLWLNACYVLGAVLFR